MGDQGPAQGTDESKQRLNSSREGAERQPSVRGGVGSSRESGRPEDGRGGHLSRDGARGLEEEEAKGPKVNSWAEAKSTWGAGIKGPGGLKVSLGGS